MDNQFKEVAFRTNNHNNNHHSVIFTTPKKHLTDYFITKIEQSNKNITSRNYSKPKTKCFSPTQSNITHLTNNECPGKELCSNYQTIKTLELHIQRLNNTVDQLTKINEYLTFTLSQKEKLLSQVMDGNTMISKHKIFHFLSPDGSKSKGVNKTENQLSLNPCHSLRGKRKSTKRLGQLFNETEKISRISKDSSNNKDSNAYIRTIDTDTPVISSYKESFRRLSSSPAQTINDKHIFKSHKDRESNTNQSNHYEIIKELIKKNQKNKHHYNITGVSFLALSDIRLKEIAYNDSINLICKLASSDDLFIQSFANSTRETLIEYCDIIGSIAKDFQSLVLLIQRIKVFLSSSVQLINSLLSDNSIQVYIENTAKILSCEKALLYLYDSVSDKLIAYNSDQLADNKKGKIEAKVQKDKGEVGICFMKGEKIMIDYGLTQGNRTSYSSNSNKDEQIMSMICYPLYDSDGDIFGVIQAINKQNEHFNANDEELLEVFSKQASAILQNMKNNETTSTRLLRLRLIVNYSVEIASIDSDVEFAKRTEQILMSLFSSPDAVVYFCNENKMFNYNNNSNSKGKSIGMSKGNSNNNKQVITLNNIGVISYVIKRKECHGCSKATNCRYYNNIVDISTTDSLITYPIIDRNKDIVIGVLQTLYFSTLSEKTEKPKKNDIIIFNMLEQCFISWYQIHKGTLSFD